MTIRKSAGGGFQVKSEGGKNLSRPGLTRAQAEKRLAQVEYFKHRAPSGAHSGSGKGKGK